MIPSPLVRLFSKTLWTRRRSTRVRLLEHVILVLMGAHWTLTRLSESARWLYVLNLVFWVYVAWSLAEATRAVLIEKCVESGHI